MMFALVPGGRRIEYWEYYLELMKPYKDVGGYLCGADHNMFFNNDF